MFYVLGFEKMAKPLNPVQISSSVGTIFLGVGGALLATKTFSYFAGTDFQNDPSLQAFSTNFTSLVLASVAIGLSALFARTMLRRRLAKKLRSILQDE